MEYELKEFAAQSSMLESILVPGLFFCLMKDVANIKDAVLKRSVVIVDEVHFYLERGLNIYDLWQA